MLKPHKLCNVCKAIQSDKKILNDIYNTSYFLKGSKTSLRQLANDYKHLFKYENLLLHVKKHQFLSEKDYNERHLRQIANRAEKQIIQKKLDSIEVWDDVINEGMAKLKDGEMNIRTSDLLKAAKDKSDFHFKKQDQDFKLAEMIAFFASGANEQNLRRPYDRRVVEGEAVEHIDPAAGPTDSAQGGTDRPGTVYYPPTWDAAT